MCAVETGEHFNSAVTFMITACMLVYVLEKQQGFTFTSFFGEFVVILKGLCICGCTTLLMCSPNHELGCNGFSSAD